MIDASSSTGGGREERRGREIVKGDSMKYFREGGGAREEDRYTIPWPKRKVQ